MDDLGTLFSALGGSLERHELLDLGWTDAAIQRALRGGDVVRIRFGTYAHGPTWRHSSPVERHRILARAVVGKLGRHVYLSHHSAAAVLGLELWGVNLKEVQVGRLDGRSDRLDAGVRFHRGAIDVNELLEIEGVLVSPPARAALETALGAPLETGTVTLTSAMRVRGVTAEQIQETLEGMRDWGGVVAARRAAALADPRLESVGEVRSISLFHLHAVPLPELQHDIRDASGLLIGRSDFWWERHRHAGEFDGLVKYGRLNPYATDAGQVLVDEKRREDGIRGQHIGVSRWTWAELDRSVARRTADRIKSDLARSRRVHTRVIDLGA